NQPVGERPRPDSSGVRARRRRRVTRDDRCVRRLSARYHAHAGSLGGASSNLVSDATGRIVSFSLWRCRIGATGRAADVPESQTLTRNVGARAERSWHIRERHGTNTTSGPAVWPWVLVTTPVSSVSAVGTKPMCAE